MPRRPGADVVLHEEASDVDLDRATTAVCAFVTSVNNGENGREDQVVFQTDGVIHEATSQDHRVEAIVRHLTHPLQPSLSLSRSVRTLVLARFHVLMRRLASRILRSDGCVAGCNPVICCEPEAYTDDWAYNLHCDTVSIGVGASQHHPTRSIYNQGET